MWCAEFELRDSALSAVEPFGDEQTARVLVRRGGVPVTYTTVRAQSGEPWNEAVVVDAVGRLGLPIAGDDPSVADQVRDPARTVSVVVATRNRAPSLARCIESLIRIADEHVEFLIVDNNPPDLMTRAVVESAARRDHRVRYVLEPVAGAARARNTGTAQATGEIVAFTDDDVTVDPQWLNGIRAGFESDPAIACVTGLVCSARISTPEEQYFEDKTPLWSTRLEAETYALNEARASDDGTFPYSPGIYGTGANCAFDRAFLLELGGFDPALGPGTTAKGGEDLDLFLQTVLAGRAVLYSPLSLVWHHHRSSGSALIEQMHGYGTGLTACLMKWSLDPAIRKDMLSRVPAGVRRFRGNRARHEVNRGPVTARPRGAARAEYQGYLSGPLRYLVSRRSVRRRAGRADAETNVSRGAQS